MEDYLKSQYQFGRRVHRMNHLVFYVISPAKENEILGKSKFVSLKTAFRENGA